MYVQDRHAIIWPQVVIGRGLSGALESVLPCTLATIAVKRSDSRQYFDTLETIWS